MFVLFWQWPICQLILFRYLLPMTNVRELHGSADARNSRIAKHDHSAWMHAKFRITLLLFCTKSWFSVSHNIFNLRRNVLVTVWLCENPPKVSLWEGWERVSSGGFVLSILGQMCCLCWYRGQTLRSGLLNHTSVLCLQSLTDAALWWGKERVSDAVFSMRNR